MNEKEQQIYTELLVIRCQQGQTEAFELIVRLWQKPLLGFALRYLDQKTDTLDAVQETWVAAINGMDKLQNPSLFVSWLFRILTNKCIDRIRKKQTQRNLLKNVDVKSESSKASSESEFLAQAIEKLSEEQKTVIMLRFSQGLQVEQVAAILNIAEGTVRSRQHRALARLREILGDKL